MFGRMCNRAFTKVVSGLFTPAGKYDHNPFVGPRPMEFPYTIAARIAQFPYVFHYRYSMIGRAFVAAVIPLIPLNWYFQRKSFSPANVQEWDQRRKEWYGVVHEPEWDLY